jgi:hypothetical protein
VGSERAVSGQRAVEWSRRETTMQRTEGVALVAGATLGLGGGVLGAFVACTLGQAVAYRVLEQCSDQYLDLGPPARLAARPAGLVSDEQDLPHVAPVTVTVAVRACGLPAPQR